MNKGFAVFGAVTLAALASLSVSQGRTLTVSSFGLNQALIDKNVTRPFEAKCGCKIVYETGNNADRLAKLVARKDNPNVDVTLLGDASAKLAANQGLLEALDLKKLKNHARLYDFAKNPLGGQHHVCFEVPDIHAAKAEFEAMGKRVLGEPRIGAHGTMIFFVHPKDMGGMLTEIMETPAQAH